MGTSTPFAGPKNGNPLLPSWLSGADGQPDGAPPPADGADDGPDAAGDRDAHRDAVAGPPEPPPNAYFRPGRTLMNRHLRGGGSEDRGHVARALASYVRQGAGGAATAGRRAATSSGGAAGRLADLLFDASRDGIREVIRRLDLGALAQRSIREIYASLVDVVCGEGGDLDESMNRDAYMTAVDELSDVDGIDLERPTAETINLLIERFIVGTIDNRLKNAVANGIVLLPDSIEDAASAEADVRDFVDGAVRSAMAGVGRLMSGAGVRSAIERIYTMAMGVLEGYADDPDGGDA
ncbi:Qat anti-phage system associated protein QatB [Aurantimonas coralicida]|uniref:Qat anti-phage system associated protein QatB n=1 Tax=Aurantimonas coralicida TaxID=182270 RepID=UPI001D180D62|nr:Qat anti-phage system associated protein QatB [Aurantimonas coralicida]MCC4300051.1 hypothetical protein [Aurantimonas coralicida]